MYAPGQALAGLSLKFACQPGPVASAENGKVALDVVDEFQPEVILLDMMMPVMGGLEFMRAINDRMAKLPHVIVFSNISAPSQVDSVMKLGAKTYWTKSDYTPDRVVTELVKLWQDK